MISLPNDNLVTLIKKIAVQAVKAQKPATYLTGTVKSLSPLTITVGQKMELEKDFLVASDMAKSRMKVGSTVLMLRAAGGQSFAVVDTIGGVLCDPEYCKQCRDRGCLRE